MRDKQLLCSVENKAIDSQILAALQSKICSGHLWPQLRFKREFPQSISDLEKEIKQVWSWRRRRRGC